MTPSEFRAALASLHLSQRGFAHLLVERGHTAQPSTVERSVRRWCEVGPPGEAVVILSLLRDREARAG